MKYRFKTVIGPLEIAPHEKLAGLSRLWLGSFLIGTYKSVAAAVESVAKRKTGCEAVDVLENFPSKLADWEKIP
jgi:hypothetical protein